MKDLFAVFIGGGIGSVLRYGIAKLPWSLNWPLNTFIANLLACFILGVAATILVHRLNVPEHWRLLILVGFCGGLSTFSTYSAEILQQFKDQKFLELALYFILSNLLGILGVFLGSKIF